MWLSYNRKWKVLRELFNKNLPKHRKAILEEYKFCSFFKHSLLPRRLSRKFDKDIVIRNTKKEYLTGEFKSCFSWQNRNTIKILMRGFLALYLALLYLYACKILNEKRVFLAAKIHGIGVFNYFNNNYFNEYYFNNKYLKILVEGYGFDKNFYNSFINYYNFCLFSHLKIFEVILNFEDYKYEDDKILYANSNIKNYKNKKKIIMHTDFFDFIQRKNRVRLISKWTIKNPFYKLPWNVASVEEDNLIELREKKKLNLKTALKWNNNLFNSFIIYELCFNIYKFLFSFFNYDFFSKVLIFLKKEKEEKKSILIFYLLHTIIIIWSF